MTAPVQPLPTLTAAQARELRAVAGGLPIVSPTAAMALLPLRLVYVTRYGYRVTDLGRAWLAANPERGG